MKDQQTLELIYDLMVSGYGESPYDCHMRRFRAVIDNLSQPSRLQEAFAGLVKYRCWKLGLSEADIALSALLEKKLNHEQISYRTTSQTGNDVTFFLE